MIHSRVIAAALMIAASLGTARPVLSQTPSDHISLAGFSSPSAVQYTKNTTRMELSDDEREFIMLINAGRRERGLAALTPDIQLVQMARAHSYDMCVRNYFSHTAPQMRLHSPMDRYLSDLHAEGLPTPDHLTVGENIYYCSGSQDGDDVAFAHHELMNSPDHRDNILNPAYDHIGVGVYRDAKGQLWVTENFLSESD
jgi:uncharacterized protein YkwD